MTDESAGTGELDREGKLERLALLSLLEGNKTAMLLIVTWPNKTIRTEGYSARDKKQTVMKWAQLAGVRVSEVEAMWPMLFGNKFVHRDGTVDQITLSWVRRELAKESGLL